MDLHLGSKGATWDQFAANEQQFGVRTTYDEDLYTTKLDKGRAKMSAAEADRIAAEIEGQGPPASRHLPDERGAAAALDEVCSALHAWQAVVRDSARARGHAAGHHEEVAAHCCTGTDCSHCVSKPLHGLQMLQMLLHAKGVMQPPPCIRLAPGHARNWHPTGTIPALLSLTPA